MCVFSWQRSLRIKFLATVVFFSLSFSKFTETFFGICEKTKFAFLFVNFIISNGDFLFSFFLFLFYRASSPLAQLYSTSTMEHHHFDQCIMILNSQVISDFVKKLLFRIYHFCLGLHFKRCDFAGKSNSSKCFTRWIFTYCKSIGRCDFINRSRRLF